MIKSKLTLLPPLPPQPEPPDYAEIYKRVFREFFLSSDMAPKDWMKRFAYLGIKGTPIIFKDDIDKNNGKPFPSEELLDTIWALIENIQIAISEFTPNEFTKIFPVEKWYKGDRYEEKDYFSTMKRLQGIGMDTAIGEEHTSSLLFDYKNPHVAKFNVFKLEVVDRLRAYQGEPPIMEAFLAKQGVFPMTLMTDENGKQFFHDPVKQTCYSVAKKRPRYLRLVK